MRQSAPPKVLIVRFSSIGDIVLTSPVVRCVHEQLGGEVHFLTKKAYVSLLAGNPRIDKIYSIQKDLREVVSELQEERYDFIVDLHTNLRTFHLKALLRRPSRSFPKLNFQKWLLTTFKWDRMPAVHVVDRYLKAAESLGVHYDGKGLEHFVQPADQVDPVALSRSVNGGELLANNDFLVFAIGAAHATKRLTPLQIKEFCTHAPWPVFLVGGPADQEVGAQAAGPGVWNMCGQLSVQQSADLIRQARVVLTHDTGMMHLAAAFQRPIVSVWGNTVPAFGMTPFYPEGEDLGVLLEQKELNCRPCSKIGYSSCPKGHFRCMRDHTVESILEAVGRLWG
jgi:ADP-heptose:LPS heptosyltransferase